MKALKSSLARNTALVDGLLLDPGHKIVLQRSLRELKVQFLTLLFVALGHITTERHNASA